MLEALRLEVLHPRVCLDLDSNALCHHLRAVAVLLAHLTGLLAGCPLVRILSNALCRLDPTAVDLSVLTCRHQEARDAATQLVNSVNVERAHQGQAQ